MEPYYVGLDVHSRQSAFVMQDASGRVVAQGEMPTTRAALAAWRAHHQLPAGTPVALETGTVAFFVARQLATLELRPVVVDAHEAASRRTGRRRRATGVTPRNSARAFGGGSIGRSSTCPTPRCCGCE